MTGPDTIRTARQCIENEWGHLDLLINNAGISGIIAQTAIRTPVHDFKAVFEVNYMAP